jgi:hypothetical protein
MSRAFRIGQNSEKGGGRRPLRQSSEPAPQLMESLPNRHEMALREWRRWCRARFQREREDALIKLWKLCKPEVWAVVKKFAADLSESRGSPGSISPQVWLLMHGWTYEGASYIALPGVWKAAEGFEPAKGTFQTYAYWFILGEISDELARGGHPNEGITVPDVPDEEASPERLVRRLDLLLRIMAVPRGSLVGQIYRETSSLPSEDLEDTVALIKMLLSEQPPHEKQSLEIARSVLISQSIRAADREGRMVRVSDLAQMLRARKDRNPMNEKLPSYAQLQRQFGISDKTIKEWLGACKEAGTAADDLSPESLDRLSRIMTPRRGPRAGQRQIPSSD